MKVASKVKDGRINAVNILLDMNIREYLEVAGNIIKNNEFQRKRVKNSSTVYALLKKDLRSNCTMPPIVLAIKAEKMNHLLNPYDVDEEQIKSLFKPENLIILDGLQRTYTILDLVDELKKENNIEVNQKVYDCFTTEMEDFDKTSFYTIGAFDNSYSARKILDYSLADKAKADKDAMDAAIADGESREEALAQYLTDENFQSWYTEFCHSLECI